MLFLKNKMHRMLQQGMWFETMSVVHTFRHNSHMWPVYSPIFSSLRDLEHARSCRFPWEKHYTKNVSKRVQTWHCKLNYTKKRVETCRGGPPKCHTWNLGIMIQHGLMGSILGIVTLICLSFVAPCRLLIYLKSESLTDQLRPPLIPLSIKCMAICHQK